MAEEFAERKPQSVGHGFNVPQGDVALAPLDPANVGTVESTTIGKRFLGEVGFLSHSADALPEPRENVGT